MQNKGRMRGLGARGNRTPDGRIRVGADRPAQDGRLRCSQHTTRPDLPRPPSRPCDGGSGLAPAPRLISTL